MHAVPTPRHGHTTRGPNIMANLWTIVISLDSSHATISSIPPEKTNFTTAPAMQQPPLQPHPTYNYVLGSNNTTFTHARDVSTSQQPSRKRRMLSEEEDRASERENEEPEETSTDASMLCAENTPQEGVKTSVSAEAEEAAEHLKETSDKLWLRLIKLPRTALPTVEECVQLMKPLDALASVPIRKVEKDTSARACSFFMGQRCQYEDDKGQQCPHVASDKTSTTSMWSHALSQHNKAASALFAFREAQREYRLQQLEDEQRVVISTRQLTLEEMKDRASKKSQPHTKDWTDGWYTTLIRWIVMANLPLSTFRHPAFIDVAHYLDHKAAVPAMSTIKNTLLAQKLMLKTWMCEVLKDVKGGSFTTDSWSSNGQGHKFLGLTFHWIDDSFMPQELMLDMKYLPVRHTAEALQTAVDDIFEEFPLKDKLVVGTTDSGANIKCAMGLLKPKAEWMPCSAHRIQIAVNKTLNKSRKDNGFKDLVTKCHQLATKIRNSGTLRGLLMSRRRSRKIAAPGGTEIINLIDENVSAASSEDSSEDVTDDEALMPILDVPTRWNSTFSMIERLVRIQGSLEWLKSTLQDMDTGDSRALREDCTTLWLSNEDIELAEDFLVVFRPAFEFTRLVSTQTRSTISQVYPWIYDQVWKLNEPIAPKLAAGEEAQTFLLEKMKSGFSLQAMPGAALIATYLNPVAKSHQIFDEQITIDREKILMWKHANSLILSAAKDAYKHGKIKLEAPVKDDSDDEDEPEERNMESLLTSAVIQELADYRRYRPKDTKRDGYFNDPLLWWKRRIEYKKFPLLRQLAQIYFSVQSSSVPSERLFSSAKNIVTDLRNSLSPGTIEDFSFCQQAYKAKAKATGKQ